MPFFQYYQTEFINILNIIKERLTKPTIKAMSIIKYNFRVVYSPLLKCHFWSFQTKKSAKDQYVWFRYQWQSKNGTRNQERETELKITGNKFSLVLSSHNV